MFGASSELASVMEFGFYGDKGVKICSESLRICDQTGNQTVLIASPTTNLLRHYTTLYNQVYDSLI